MRRRILVVSSLLATSLSIAQDPVSSDARDRPRPVRKILPGLPVWHYQVVSPVNGLRYSGYMVGTDPTVSGARTTMIRVILVPFIVQFTNTTTGFTTTFDPSSAPDAGCTASLTA